MAKDKGIFVSASAIVDYLKCSQQVYYRIFEPELKIPNREMIMGQITHKVVEKAWQNKDVALNLGMSLCVKDNVDDVGKQSVEHFIHTFFEKFTPLLRAEDKIEKFFKIKMHDDVYLVGKLDRICSGNIMDWKTTANPPKKIFNDPQFIIYDYAYKLMYEKNPEGIYLASLSNGNLVRYTRSEQHYNTLVNDIIPQFIDVVRNKKFIKDGLFKGACYRCPYKVPCLGDKSVVSELFTEE
jgi:PD-(D/E)XK nuclease superfamily protein